MLMKRKDFFTLLKIYGFTWILILVVFFVLNVYNGNSFTNALEFLPELLVSKSFQLIAHGVFLVCCLVFIVLRYSYRTYKKKGWKVALKQISLQFILPIGILFSIYAFVVNKNMNENFDYSWNTSVENKTGNVTDLYTVDGKHRGMSVFGWHRENETLFADLTRNNIEWVAVTPFFFQKNEQTKVMRTPKEVGKWTRRDSSYINFIGQLHDKNIRVNLKPHLWMNEGWRSNINFETDEEWATWFESYRKNMIHYSKMAALTQVELLCVGTELKTSLKQQPEAWLALIKEIKTIYKGKLTYAANWDDIFDQTEFWSTMDYVGVQAYFPLTKEKAPELLTIKKGWERHITELEKLSQKFNKPILFTEIGYRSDESATIKPWEWDTSFSKLSKKKSDKTQQLAYEAMFQSLWHKKWFKGAYIWQWDTRSTEENAPQNLDFTPRFKPAENTIAKWYGNPSEDLK